MKAVIPFAFVLLGVAVASLRAAPETTMQLTSNDFASGGGIPKQFTCEGGDMSPSLRLQNAPKAAKSLALILDDPDAPSGTFTHWLVWNISPEATEFPVNRTPTGVVQGINDFGKTGYGGPCPPSGRHRYYFRLYALDAEVKLAAGATRAALEAAMHGHVLAQATLMGTYRKPR